MRRKREALFDFEIPSLGLENPFYEEKTERPRNQTRGNIRVQPIPVQVVYVPQPRRSRRRVRRRRQPHTSEYSLRDLASGAQRGYVAAKPFAKEAASGIRSGGAWLKQKYYERQGARSTEIYREKKAKWPWQR